MVNLKSLKVGDRISYKKDGIMCLWIGEIIEIFPNACKVKSITRGSVGDITYVPNNSIYDKEIKETTMNTQGKSYTFTREELIKTMREGIVDVLKDNVEGLIDGSVEIGFFDNWSDIENKRTDDLIQWWCDMYSDKFFEANPDIEDALILIEKTENITTKEWMASR